MATGVRSGGQGTGRVVLDPPDNLVTEHQWFPQGERTYGAVLVVMQIRSADTAMGVAHEDLPRFGRPGGQIVESQIVGGWSMRPSARYPGCPRARSGPRVGRGWAAGAAPGVGQWLQMDVDATITIDHPITSRTRGKS
jgi:hypothetical protein